MPEWRLERARRAYDRVIDMGPYACKMLDVGTQDTRALNALWRRPSENAAEQLARRGMTANVIEGEQH